MGRWEQGDDVKRLWIMGSSISCIVLDPVGIGLEYGEGEVLKL
jgi:hypothetical protein